MSTEESSPAESQHYAPTSLVLGLIGTFILCGAVLMAHLSAPQLKPVAVGLWLLGLMTQAGAFGLACANRWASRDPR
jgi:glycerol uptake facilitator-like aquaporin